MAWNPLGWRAQFVSEIDRFPCALLADRHPGVPNFGDMTKFHDWPDANIDVLVGGTPCQSFSVAGLRGGLDDPRGNLMLTYLAIAARYRPRWLVWENVPGVLSADGGRAFGSLLGGMAQLGFGFAYRVLDAQYFNLAQRRERVFVVGCAGSWQRAAAVLFERSSLRGDSAPRRQAREKPAGTITGSLARRGGQPGEGNPEDFLISKALCARSNQANNPEHETYVVQTLLGETGRLQLEANDVAHALRADGFDASEDGTGRGTPLIAFNTRQDPISGPISGPLDTDGTTQAVAFSCKDHGADAGDLAPTPRARGEGPRVLQSPLHTIQGGPLAVRRLTPAECEALQGFPRNYTLIEYRGKPAADGPRYKALGNSMPVPVMRFLGERIDAVDSAAKATR